jgi:L-alanine-DL-glutamate epimerase-like enolase superfamily enzyme
MKCALRRCGGQLPRAVGSARAPVRERYGLLLRVDDGARVGWGEASPLPGFSRDTLDECEAQLAAWCARGAPPTAPAAQFAVETALAGLANLAGRAPAGPLALAAVVETADEARAAVARGLGAVKLKVGRDFDAELRRLHEVRAAVGDAVALRVDANRAWSRAEAPARLRALAALRPEFVEEPLAGGLGGARLASPVPLAADETLLDGRVPPVDVLVLKPMALGGATCRRLAREFGGPVVVTHLWDGPVALAAAAALARSLDGPVLACGLDRHAGLAVWP